MPEDQLVQACFGEPNRPLVAYAGQIGVHLGKRGIQVFEHDSSFEQRKRRPPKRRRFVPSFCERAPDRDSGPGGEGPSPARSLLRPSRFRGSRNLLRPPAPLALPKPPSSLALLGLPKATLPPALLGLLGLQAQQVCLARPEPPGRSGLRGLQGRSGLRARPARLRAFPVRRRSARPRIRRTSGPAGRRMRRIQGTSFRLQQV